MNWAEIEKLFDYLITTLAQKAKKLVSCEYDAFSKNFKISKKLKICKISKIFNILKIFKIFKILKILKF